MPQTHQNPQPQVIELGSQRVQQGLGFVEMRRGSVYSLVSQGLRALWGLIGCYGALQAFPGILPGFQTESSFLLYNPNPEIRHLKAAEPLA